MPIAMNSLKAFQDLWLHLGILLQVQSDVCVFSYVSLASCPGTSLVNERILQLEDKLFQLLFLWY